MNQKKLSVIDKMRRFYLSTLSSPIKSLHIQIQNKVSSAEQYHENLIGPEISFECSYAPKHRYLIFSVKNIQSPRIFSYRGDCNGNSHGAMSDQLRLPKDSCTHLFLIPRTCLLFAVCCSYVLSPKLTHYMNPHFK